MYLDNLTWKGTKNWGSRPKAPPPHHQLLLYQHLRAIICNVTCETFYEGHARCSQKHMLLSESRQHCNQAKSCHKSLILARLQCFWPGCWFRRLAPPAAAGGTQTGKALTSVSSNLAQKNRKGMVQKRLVLIRKNSSCAKFTLSLGWNAVRRTSYIIHEKNLTLEGPDGSWVSLGGGCWLDRPAPLKGKLRRGLVHERFFLNESNDSTPETVKNSAGTWDFQPLKGESYV